ncbi:hypothetical protein [Massilia sp. ST3]|uniref:hypothetical protein n=1 Tax=Massilia sp. ST3 TaxID=2824903 RepID=UPI001B815303|nr:hypothetical protein [Massilia sp. ST3]MBQ5946307.1 hypothetical protein [Massilia sp. ST3]
MAIHKAGLFSGIVGGLLSGAATFGIMNYFCTVVTRPSLSDAVSIANTYIVFTTIIFVAITLFLTVAGLWFTQQFAASKELQIKHLISEIEQKLADNDDEVGVKLVDKAFSNQDVSRHVQEILESKLQQLINSLRESAKNDHAAADELSKKLKSGA